jgi:class 3 adenylate cyclase
VRARWLAELAEALEQAERLLKRVAAGNRYDPMILELELRIGAARGELESLRTSRQARAESAPRWIGIPPWEQASPRGA